MPLAGKIVKAYSARCSRGSITATARQFPGYPSRPMAGDTGATKNAAQGVRIGYGLEVRGSA
ncbi:MAG TPA: hypothetical protein VES20_10475, partial [Bryobacteraceae bacterium]|nr:hypothetical protein [Bryobacteraceae bacterium]